MAADGPPLDLDRPRAVGELIATTVELFRRHSGLFLSVTVLVVAPYVVLVDGVWGRELRDGPHNHPGTAASLASTLLGVLVIPPLVTGLHAVIVRSLGQAVVPAVGRALRDVAPRLPAAFGAVALSTVGLVVGFALLIVPGIWLWVRWYFAAQAAVLDGASPQDAIARSAALVNRRWWQAAGALLASTILFSGLAALVQVAVRQVHQPLAYVVLTTVVQAVTLSLVALFGTLLYFSLRAQPATVSTPAAPADGGSAPAA